MFNKDELNYLYVMLSNEAQCILSDNEVLVLNSIRRKLDKLESCTCEHDDV